MSIHRCRIAESPLNATVTIPGSKSLTNRALIAAALADGTSLLRNILVAEDTLLMIEALRAMGVSIALDADNAVAEVTGCRGQVPAEEAEVFCGNAGTVMRFVAALSALGQGLYSLDGVPRMRERPIGGLVSALQALGAGVEYLEKEGFPPIRVHAQGLRGGSIEIPSPGSSQWVSAILLVAPYAQRDVLLEVTGRVTSKPYLTMTTAVMADFGVAVVEQFEGPSPLSLGGRGGTEGGSTAMRESPSESGAKFIVEASQRYQATTWTCEPDASNATYFLAAPAIAGGRVTVDGLGTDSRQGDARFVDVLEQMGCRIEREPTRLTVYAPAERTADGHPRLRAVDVDLSDMPDTVQTLAVLALFADGPTTIRNVPNLRLKETDRLAALARELSKLGATVDERPDGLRITPRATLVPATPTPAVIDTYNDHRMAMSFALAGLRIPGLQIRDPQCCEKTFPDFFERFERMLPATG